MTMDQGNLQSCKRTACGPQPALQWSRPREFLSGTLCFGAEPKPLTLCTASWHVTGFATGVVTQLGRKDVGKPLTWTVLQHRHVGPDPGVALLSSFICLFCELLSFFPWRKDALSNLAERENLTHICLLWLWYPARGKGQSPEVMVEWVELIEGKIYIPLCPAQGACSIVCK